MAYEVCVLYVLRGAGDDAEVLLGRKRTGLGAGRVVGPGGKLEPGERAVEAVLRELGEEVGVALTVTDVVFRGRHVYRFPTRPAWDQNSSVFVARHLAGEPVASEELSPFWCPVRQVPYGQMWADASLWLPSVLRGGDCGGEYVYAADLESLE